MNDETRSARGSRHEILLQRSSTKGHRRSARGSRRTNHSQRSSWNSSRRSMNDQTRSARGSRHEILLQRSSTKGHRRSARGSRRTNHSQRSSWNSSRRSMNDQTRSARGLRRENLLQRTSVRSSRGFRSSRRSSTPSRTSTASFLRSPATSCLSPVSSDGCSPPSSTTSGESSRCASRPRGASPPTQVARRPAHRRSGGAGSGNGGAAGLSTPKGTEHFVISLASSSHLHEPNPCSRDAPRFWRSDATPPEETDESDFVDGSDARLHGDERRL